MRAGLFVMLVGCGRLGFAFDPGAHDANTAGTDGAGDGAADATMACASFGPWGTPTPLSALNSPTGDYGPTPSPDGLELVFHSDRPGTGGFDLYVATRASHTSAFATFTPLTMLDTTANDENATFTPDGLTLFFTSDRSGAFRMYRTTRSAVGAAWSAPAIVSELSTLVILGPLISKQGGELFVTAGPIASAYLEAATFDGTTFSQPAVVTEFGMTPPRGWPGISPDGLTLAYEGQRAAYQIMVVTRSSIGGAWGPETALTEADDGNANEDAEWSYDGTELYFVTNRLDVGGNTFDMFVMTRSCL